MNWYAIIHDPETGTAHVILRDDVGCGGKTSGDLERDLAELLPKKVELQIDSTGGNSITGLNLNQIFSQYETHVLIIGKCYSAALTAAMAGRKIRIAPDAKILIHSPSGYFHGTADELFDGAVEIESLKRSVAAILCDRTRQSAHVVLEWLSRDTWFTAAEAVELGLADEIADLPPTRTVHAPKTELNLPTLPQKTEAEKLFGQWLTAFGQLQVADKNNFTRDLVAWANLNTIQL